MTGSTGEVGGRLARRLAERGERQKLIVRDAARAPNLPGVEVVTFEGYADTPGMRASFAGVTTLFLVSAHESEDRVAQHKRAVEAAIAAGVERIVYLSFIGAEADATFTFARDHFATEEYIRASGIPLTFSRQNLYMDILPYLGGEEGVIRGPAGKGRVAPVHRDDVADALAVMMTGSDHVGATYTLTGSEALTLTQIAEQLTRTSDRVVSYEDETLEEAKASRAKYNAPVWEVEGWISTYTAIAAGEMDVVTDDVKRLTGRDPVQLAEFLNRLGEGTTTTS